MSERDVSLSGGVSRQRAGQLVQPMRRRVLRGSPPRGWLRWNVHGRQFEHRCFSPVGVGEFIQDWLHSRLGGESDRGSGEGPDLLHGAG